MMEERNAVVSKAAEMMIETGLETDNKEAHALAQDGYVRRLVKASNTIRGSWVAQSVRNTLSLKEPISYHILQLN